MNKPPVYILGIESSCDETSAAITRNDKVLSNSIAGQEVHERYGGVVPELASRAHQQHIIPVVQAAFSEAGITMDQVTAVAFTRGPGLIGSLLVGTSFAKTFALAKGIPLIEVNHMQAHVIGNFASREGMASELPSFPFLCLTVSGGHTQIVLVRGVNDMDVIGQTMDDAAGEAFDKVAKMLALPYPGGPQVDKLAAQGNPNAYPFPHPAAPELNFSFSGLKTSVLYFLQKQRKLTADFPGEHMADVCASVQKTIVDILLEKFNKAIDQTGVTAIALAGGVSANSGLRRGMQELASKRKLSLHIPDFEYCTDNAGMIALAGYYRYLDGVFAPLDVAPLARFPF